MMIKASTLDAKIKKLGIKIEAWEKANVTFRSPSLERGCKGKIKLGRNYEKRADKLSTKHGKRYGVYNCPHCGGYHLTTKLDKVCQYAQILHISEPNVKNNRPCETRHN